MSLLVWCVLGPWLAQAAITVDAVTVSGGTGDFGDDTFAHTVAADANFFLFCGAMTQSSTVETLASVTYAGQALTLLLGQSEGTENRVELWYRLAPATGTNSVVVDATDNPWFVYLAMSLKGVAQAAPTHTAQLTDAQPAAFLTIPSAAGEFVVDCLSLANDILDGADTATPGAGQTEQVNTTHDSAITLLVSTMAGAAPSVEPDWDFATETLGYAHVGVSLAELAIVGKRRIRTIYP